MANEPARTDATGLDSSNEVVSLDAGEFLFREGDAADALYIVRKGTLRVVSGSTVFAARRLKTAAMPAGIAVGTTTTGHHIILLPKLAPSCEK